jgi:H+-transporting ATPase
VDKPTCMVVGPEGRTLDEVLKWGALSANIVSEEPIDVVLHEAYDDHEHLWNDYKLQKFVPFNPTDKYTIATVKDNKTGECTRIMKGAPQVRGVPS